MKYASSFLFLFISLSLFSQQPLTLEEAVNGQYRQFYPKNLDQLNWLPGSDDFVYVKNDTLFQGNAKTKEQAALTLAQLNDWNKLTQKLTEFPDITWLDANTFYFEAEGQYLLANRKTKSVTARSRIPKDGENTDYHKASGNFAYTKGNNLFIRSGEKDIQVTNNEKDIVSGQSVSRNEYGIVKGTFWSPSGNALAFYQKDEAEVTDYPLIDYKETPAVVKYIKYPMAGAQSEKVSVGVYNLSSGTTIYLELSNGLTGIKFNPFFYATNLTWSPDGKDIYLIHINRETTEMQLRRYDAATGKLIKILITEKDDKWVEPEQPITFVKGKKDIFLWYSWQDGFHNYYLYNTNGELLRQTHARFELTEILGFNKDGTKMFVAGTGDNPTESNAYSVNLSDMLMMKITGASGTHDVQVSDSGEFILDTYNSITVPNRIDISSSGGRMIRSLLIAENPLDGRAIGNTEIFTITAADGSTPLYCRMIKPTNFSVSNKYPAVVYLYNGPHVQLVTNSWLAGSSLWMNYLAEQGYIVFTVDGRGSAHRGKAFEQAIHRQLGTVEIDDQIMGVKYLKSLHFVDPGRLAVHGWSFGGFMTTGLMLRKPGTFKVGVAGGSVIDWRMYEVMYTERYMDTPDQNPEGYKIADLTNYVADLKGDLLMIHGTDDDVVVLQHDMKFLKACIDKNILVDFFAYPGHGHNVRGKDRLHLMEKVLGYIVENLAVTR
ncbi:MAG: DPP IV N-terminal domain-containing protein [Crocinitomicaceae bacterium]|nr:DPP IV N-terminal domain-containing protein [Crocinitomicaceae bacterium]